MTQKIFYSCNFELLQKYYVQNSLNQQSIISMECKQNKSQSNSLQILKSVSKNHIQSNLPLLQSTFQDQYVRLLNKYGKLSDISLDIYKDRLRKNKIKISDYSKSSQESKQIFVANNTKGFQVAQLLVNIGRFSLQLKVLNLNYPSNLEQQVVRIGTGSFGNVYKFCSPQKKLYAIKSIKYKLLKQKGQILIGQGISLPIIQYCFTKLFSVLQIGPYVQYIFGFDLIIYQDTIQFSMEFCQNMKKQSIKQLMKDINFMHKLQIIHGDIKPQNIMWSPKHKKNVFIDFGFSKFLKQKIGYQTYTSYFGTFNYAGPQMRTLFIRRGFSFVDLYYNDVFALQKIINQVGKKEDIIFTINQEVILDQKYEEKLQAFKLMKLLFDVKISQIKKILENKRISFQQQVMEFLKQIPPSTHIGNILKQVQKISGNLTDLETIIQYHFYKLQDSKLDENKRNNFQLRFKSLHKNSTTQYFNTNMQFLLLISNQDFSLRSLQQKKILTSCLIQLKISNKKYWTNFLHFCYNPYTLKKQILTQFNRINKTLQIQWRIPNNPDLQIFFKSYQIYQCVLKKYKIDLFQMRKQLGLAMFQNITNKNSIQYIQNMELSSSQKLFLKQNWHLLSNINHRYAINWFQRYSSISQFLEQSLLIKQPSTLFSYFIQYAQFLLLEKESHQFSQFTEIFKSNEIIFKSKFVRQISNLLYRQILQLYNSQEILQLSSHFMRFSYNFCFEFYLCRHSYFLELIFKPYIDQQEQFVIEGIKQIFLMKRKDESADYFYKDLSIFQKNTKTKTWNRKLNIYNCIYKYLKQDFCTNKQHIGTSNITECQDFLRVLQYCYNSQVKDYAFISEIFKNFRIKMQNQHPILNLLYVITQVHFYKFRSGINRKKELFLIITDLISNFPSNSCILFKRFQFQAIKYALSLQNGYFKSIETLYRQKFVNYFLEKNLVEFNLLVDRYCYVILAKYFTDFQKFHQCFFHLISWLRNYDLHKNKKKLPIEMELYLMTRYYLKLLHFISGQQLLLQFINHFQSFIKNSPLAQLKKLSILVIVLEFIFDAIYVSNNFQHNQTLSLIKICQFNLLFNWAHFWLSSCFHVVRNRFKTKLGFYMLNFWSSSLLEIPSKLKQKRILLKKLRNSQYILQSKSLNKIISSFITIKENKHCHRLFCLQKVASLLIKINENKKKKPQLSKTKIKIICQNLYYQFVNQASLEHFSLDNYFIIERKQIIKPVSNSSQNPTAAQLFQVIFPNRKQVQTQSFLNKQQYIQRDESEEYYNKINDV